MDKQQQPRWEEQQAPLKNTDQAFVKVGADGHPDVPGRERSETKEDDRPGEGERAADAAEIQKVNEEERDEA